MTAVSANRLFLFATAAVFGLFGVWGALDPQGMVQRFGIELITGEGRTLIRASYGGFLVGAAALFAVCALRAEWLRLGSLAVALLTAPIFLTRALGMLIDGGQSAMHLSYLAIEAIGIAMGAYFWRRRP